MQVSETGIDLIESFEGCCLDAYQDINGIWTIGYGHTHNVCEGMTITQEQATQLLLQDLVAFEGFVNHYVTVPLTQNQFNALVSFTYNLGPGTLAESTLLSVLNAGQYDNAAAMFVEYDHAGGVEVPGLKRRRLAEQALFRTPDQPDSWFVKFMKWVVG